MGVFQLDFLPRLFSCLAVQNNMLLCNRFFAVPFQLVLKYIAGRGIRQNQFGVALLNPVGRELNRHDPRSLPFNLDFLQVPDDRKKTPVFVPVRVQLDPDAPFPLSVILQWDLLDNLLPRRNSEFEHRLDNFGKHGRPQLVPPDVGFAGVPHRQEHVEVPDGIFKRVGDRQLARHARTAFGLPNNAALAALLLLLLLIGLLVVCFRPLSRQGYRGWD